MVQQESNVNRIEEMVAKEDSRLRDLNVQLDLAEVQGAQQAAKDAEVARAQAKMLKKSITYTILPFI